MENQLRLRREEKKSRLRPSKVHPGMDFKVTLHNMTMSDRFLWGSDDGNRAAKPCEVSLCTHITTQSESVEPHLTLWLAPNRFEYSNLNFFLMKKKNKNGGLLPTLRKICFPRKPWHAGLFCKSSLAAIPLEEAVFL